MSYEEALLDNDLPHLVSEEDEQEQDPPPTEAEGEDTEGPDPGMDVQANFPPDEEVSANDMLQEVQ